MATGAPVAVYYEHPRWFQPLFHELERRRIPFARIDAGRHRFDPSPPASPNGRPLLFNRMSPSAWVRGHGGAILYTLHYLAHLESLGWPLFNGLAAFTVETSKALQVSLLERLGLQAPRTRVVNHPSLIPDAAEALAYPLVVKPNVGGSGAGIQRFDTPEALRAAVDVSAIDPGLDHILLVQEYHPPRDGSIVRVETLEGKYLYGIRIHLQSDSGFDLCPADICKTAGGETLESPSCPVDAQKAGLTVERFDPPAWIVEAVERIARAAQLDVGGIEYLESDRDGRVYFYDINALSNFVPDPVRLLGFDPTARLVDALAARAESAAHTVSAGRSRS